MQNERINTLPIENFIKQVKSADANREKEIRIDLQQAKNITFTLGLILARLNGRLEDDEGRTRTRTRGEQRRRRKTQSEGRGDLLEMAEHSSRQSPINQARYSDSGHMMIT